MVETIKKHHLVSRIFLVIAWILIYPFFSKSFYLVDFYLYLIAAMILGSTAHWMTNHQKDNRFLYTAAIYTAIFVFFGWYNYAVNQLWDVYRFFEYLIGGHIHLEGMIHLEIGFFSHFGLMTLLIHMISILAIYFLSQSPPDVLGEKIHLDELLKARYPSGYMIFFISVFIYEVLDYIEGIYQTNRFYKHAQEINLKLPELTPRNFKPLATLIILLFCFYSVGLLYFLIKRKKMSPIPAMWILLISILTSYTILALFQGATIWDGFGDHLNKAFSLCFGFLLMALLIKRISPVWAFPMAMLGVKIFNFIVRMFHFEIQYSFSTSIEPYLFPIIMGLISGLAYFGLSRLAVKIQK